MLIPKEFFESDEEKERKSGGVFARLSSYILYTFGGRGNDFLESLYYFKKGFILLPATARDWWFHVYFSESGQATQEDFDCHHKFWYSLSRCRFDWYDDVDDFHEWWNSNYYN